MNNEKSLKNFINNYHFPYLKEELEMFSIILKKIINILYNNANLGVLDSREIIFLKEKKLLDLARADLIISYIDYIKNGYILKDETKNKIYKLLENIAFNLRGIDDEWKNANLCNKLLHVPLDIKNMNQNEIKVLVNMISNSNINDYEKEELLINLSLNLNSNVNKKSSV